MLSGMRDGEGAKSIGFATYKDTEYDWTATEFRWGWCEMCDIDAPPERSQVIMGRQQSDVGQRMAQQQK